MTLKELKIGESAVIDTVGGTGELRQHFLDMGLIPGEKVTLVKFAPMGDGSRSPRRKHPQQLRHGRSAGWWSTRAWARAAATTPKRANTRCRMERC